MNQFGRLINSYAVKDRAALNPVFLYQQLMDLYQPNHKEPRNKDGYTRFMEILVLMGQQLGKRIEKKRMRTEIEKTWTIVNGSRASKPMFSA